MRGPEQLDPTPFVWIKSADDILAASEEILSANF